MQHNSRPVGQHKPDSTPRSYDAAHLLLHQCSLADMLSDVCRVIKQANQRKLTTGALMVCPCLVSVA